LRKAKLFEGVPVDNPLNPPVVPVGWLLRKFKLLEGRLVDDPPKRGGGAGLLRKLRFPDGAVPFCVVETEGEDKEVGLAAEYVAFVDGRPVTAGVVGPEPGIGGSDSNNEAPKEDDGLNGFRPLNPVRWDLMGGREGTCIEGADEAAVAPVG